ncbi:MAG: Vms1/Ankzf1 family peptidyl-tRNA hydrolase [Acidobacteriota bacterium]|nr:Vms1/Ankzf1 family peptidyl-tRNA hydrolase [Acidobacteriota bacterium]
MLGPMPTTALRETLRGLAGCPDTGPPVVSLYLDARKDDPTRRKVTQIFVRHRLKDIQDAQRRYPAHANSLAEDAAKIRDALDARLAPGRTAEGQGLVLFSSSGRGLWTRIEAPRPFANRLIIRQVPHLLQLVRMTGIFREALLCQADSRSARILEFDFGTLEGEFTISHPEIPGRHAQGGWSQTRYQRRIDWQRERHLREVAETFVQLADQRPAARLIISAPPEPLALLRAVLPRRILERNPVDIHLKPGVDLSAISQVMLWLLERLAAKDNEVRRIRIFAEATKSGTDIGVEACCRAANAGAIEELLIQDRLERLGWRCRDCGLLDPGRSPGSCPACSSKLVRCDLTARLAEKVLAEGGYVAVIDGGRLLKQAGGMIAHLRFRV